MGSPVFTNLASKTAPAWAPHCTGPQGLPGTCSSVGSPHSHSLLHVQKGVHLKDGYLLHFHGLRENILPHHPLLQGCGGIWSSAWSTSSLSFLTGLGVYGSAFLTCYHYSSGCFPQPFFLFFNRLSQKMLLLLEMSVSQMGCVLTRGISVLKLDGTGSI